MQVAASALDVRSRWNDRLSSFLPDFFKQHPVLTRFYGEASVLLHGSTTMGVDDATSDLDLWFLLPDASLAQLRAASETTFFSFELDGKKGHLNAESMEGFLRRICACNMDLIYQLRAAVTLADPEGRAAEFVAEARRPMRPPVREAFFFYHYVEMRGDHRACDTPIDRGESVALLLFLPKVLAHALRAALVLDGQPYPYDKWLYRAAMQSPTGQRLQPAFERLMDLLGNDGLRLPGSQDSHPINLELRAIRQALIAAARAGGLDAPWLDRWWHYMEQAREAIVGITWSQGTQKG